MVVVVVIAVVVVAVMVVVAVVVVVRFWNRLPSTALSQPPMATWPVNFMRDARGVAASERTTTRSPFITSKKAWQLRKKNHHGGEETCSGIGKKPRHRQKVVQHVVTRSALSVLTRATGGRWPLRHPTDQEQQADTDGHRRTRGTCSP